jgi:hypothetical protein
MPSNPSASRSSSSTKAPTPAPDCLHRGSRPGTRAAASPACGHFLPRIAASAPPGSSCRSLPVQGVFTQPRPGAACEVTWLSDSMPSHSRHRALNFRFVSHSCRPAARREYRHPTLMRHSRSEIGKRKADFGPELEGGRTSQAPYRWTGLTAVGVLRK